MRHARKKNMFNQDGAAAVEFALVLYPLILILFCVIEYGWYFTNRISLVNAVSAGARAGIKAETDLDARVWAVETAKAAFWPGDLETVQVAVYPGPPRTLEVNVNAFGFSPLVGFLPTGWLPNKLVARAVMAFP